MASLKEVKERIQSVKSTQQITKAMKMVAAAKLRKAQERITQMRPYSQKLKSILDNVSASAGSDSDSVYGQVRSEDKVLIVLVTSDRGLCGGFNSYVIKETSRLLENEYAAQNAAGNVTLLPIGKKGYEYFKKRHNKLIADHAEIFAKLDFEKARAASDVAMDGFANGDYDKVVVVYNVFKNVATQEVVASQFLPLVSSTSEVEDASSAVEYTFEPSKQEIIQDLIPKSLKITFYSALLESNAGEMGARMTAMDKATDNAGELLKDLNLTYNRTRQAAITKEITEIVGGAAALAGN